jgi:hypothetical protein
VATLSFIDLYLAVPLWGLAAVLVLAVVVVATWPRSGRTAARLWRRLEHVIRRRS